MQTAWLKKIEKNMPRYRQIVAEKTWYTMWMGIEVEAEQQKIHICVEMLRHKLYKYVSKI